MSFEKAFRSLKSTTAIAGAALSMAMLAQPALASDNTDHAAAAVVTEAVDLTVTALQDSNISDAEADSIIELIDMERVAPFTLGRHWRTMEDAQKAEFMSAFELYARAQLREHLSGLSNADVEVVRTVERKPGDAIVITNVTGVDDKEQTVSWRLNEDGEWKITDIEVMGLWFAIEQRAQFQAVLDQNGGSIDALIAEMKKPASAG